jgi:hypothetical protein
VSSQERIYNQCINYIESKKDIVPFINEKHGLDIQTLSCIMGENKHPYQIMTFGDDIISDDYGLSPNLVESGSYNERQYYKSLLDSITEHYYKEKSQRLVLVDDDYKKLSNKLSKKNSNCTVSFSSIYRNTVYASIEPKIKLPDGLSLPDDDSFTVSMFFRFNENGEIEKVYMK